MRLIVVSHEFLILLITHATVDQDLSFAGIHQETSHGPGNTGCFHLQAPVSATSSSAPAKHSATIQLE